MKYKILQLPIDDDLCFRSWTEAQKVCPNGKELLKRYKTVYEGELDKPANRRVLNELFEIFNINHPEDYRARSLSVSDVVAFCDNNRDPISHWFCDSFGWEEIR